MVKKILVILGLCLLGGYLIFAVFYFDGMSKEKVCGRFEIDIEQENGEKFIKVEELEENIHKKGLNPYGKQLKDINTYDIQEAILENKLIKSAEVFVTSDGSIRAIVKERIPLIRISSSNGENYYIDKDGERMPLSKHSTAYLPVATGNVKEEFAKTDLYKFALFLYQNEFWNAQIEQIVVQPDGEVTLISRVGDHEILMGRLENFEEKLDRLKAFYKNALPETGWNRYTKINLKYDKQVVGTKR